MEADCIHELKAVLPDLDEDHFRRLTEHLTTVIGVKKTIHLSFIEKEDLENHPVECRQVVRAFKQNGETACEYKYD